MCVYVDKKDQGLWRNVNLIWFDSGILCVINSPDIINMFSSSMTNNTLTLYTWAPTSPEGTISPSGSEEAGTGFWNRFLASPWIPASVIRICTFCLNTHPASLRPPWERFRVLGNLVCRLQRWVFWWVWCQYLTQRSVDFYFRQILRLEPLKWEIMMGKLAFSSQLRKGKICFTEPHPCFWISFSDGPFCYSTLSDFSIPLSLNKETFCLFTSVL